MVVNRIGGVEVKILDIKGFTLLELMIVIAIIGILISVTTPNFSSSKDHFKLHTTARKCIVDIRYAQQLSIDRKEKHGVYFSSTGYNIKNNLTSEIVKTVKFEGGISYIDGSINGNAVVFGTEGIPLQMNEITPFTTITKIGIISSMNFHVYVDLTPKTGEVSINWD